MKTFERMSRMVVLRMTGILKCLPGCFWEKEIKNNKWRN
jgi:hypothetical protein